MEQHTNALRGLIYARFRSMANFAELLGWTRQKVERVVNMKQEPSLKDLAQICSALEISIDEGAQIFLTRKSQEI